MRKINPVNKEESRYGHTFVLKARQEFRLLFFRESGRGETRNGTRTMLVRTRDLKTDEFNYNGIGCIGLKRL